MNPDSGCTDKFFIRKTEHLPDRVVSKFALIRTFHVKIKTDQSGTRTDLYKVFVTHGTEENEA